MTRTRILFDTDPGIDDAMALAMLALDPRAELVGITTVFGNVPIELTTRNALALRTELRTDEVLDWVATASPAVLHFVRPNGWQIVTNFGTEPYPLPRGEVLLSSGSLPTDVVEAETTLWLH